MTKDTEHARREARRIREVAREYRDRGYEVFVEEFPSEFARLPRTPRPDLIARNEDETVVIEVKSGRWSTEEAQALSRLAEVVDANQWRLELVVTNPRSTPDGRIVPSEDSVEAWESRVETATHYFERREADPGLALVMFWAGAEPMLQQAIEQVATAKTRIPRAVTGVIKNLYSLGLMTEREMDELLEAYELRSGALHRGERPNLSPKKLARWAKIVNHVSRAAEQPAA